MREALASAVADEIIHHRHTFPDLDRVDQPPALPHRPADRGFALHQRENAFAVDRNPRVLLDHGSERSAAVIAHFEPQVVEAQQQTVRGALGDAHREHSRQPTAHDEVLVGVGQRVNQLANPLFCHFLQREHRVARHRVPREQRDHLGDEQRRDAFLPVQHLDDAFAVTGTQRQQFLDLGIGDQ